MLQNQSLCELVAGKRCTLFLATTKAWAQGPWRVCIAITTCCYGARSVPFDDSGYLCLRGWEYFSHFNRELEHVFTHNWNESVLGFYDFVCSGSVTETLSITYGFSNGILSSHFGISVPSNGITISGSWDSFCVGFANGISNRLK